MKKIISFILSVIMAITLVPQIDIHVSAMGYDPSVVVNLALSKVGTNYMNGYCLAFVRQMFESAYGFSSTSCCAYKYGSRYIDSTSRSNIPLGADVFFGGSSKTCSTCGNKCGHIGIYVGDDYVVHGWNGKIEKYKIDRIINSGYPYRGWGWHNDIALGEVSTNPDDYSFPERTIYYNSSSVMRGSDVGWIQAVLYQCGYNVNIDCSFGPATKAIVEQFQRDNGLTVDGSVGPATREKLRQKWEEKKKSNVTLLSVSVSTLPAKTSYFIGESLDLTGLVITAEYSDGTKKTVTEDYSVSGFDSSSAGTKTVTVTFDGKAATFTVTVKEPVSGELKISDTAAFVGQNVAIPVYIEKTKVMGVSVDVQFDPSALKYKGYSDKVFDIVEENTDNISNGLLSLACVNSGNAVDGKIIILNFEVVAVKECIAKISVSSLDATDGENQVVLKGSEAAVKISSRPGDVTGDGQVTTQDAIWILQSITKKRTLTNEQKLAADVTGEGNVTTQDAIWILQSIVGKRAL